MTIHTLDGMSAGALILRIKLLGRTVESFVRKYRSYLSPRGYRLSRQVGDASLDLTGDGKVSVISLNSSEILIDSGRYFYGLVSGLLGVGHRVYVVKKVWVVTELLKKQHTRSLVNDGKLSFVTESELRSKDGSGSYLWTDHDASWEGAKIVKISRSNHQHQDGLWIPYQVHPANSPLPSECQPSEVSQSRDIKVFFSGRVTPSYDSDFVKSHGVMTRNEILESLYESELPKFVYDELTEVQPEFDSRVLLPRYNPETKRSSGSVPKEHYLDNFKNVSFVICAPGTFMPFAHNVVEAISQGCIPILEYGSYFTPNLVDGENSLAFNDHESLVKAIKMALAMDREELTRMRGNVIRYYHDYLKFSSFMGRVDQEKTKVLARYTA